jgi:hypothetical protein
MRSILKLNNITNLHVEITVDMMIPFPEFMEYHFPAINIFLTTVLDCIKNMTEDVLIIPIGTEYPEGHRNVLIYRKPLNVLEHFEPNGHSLPYTEDYLQNEFLYSILRYIVHRMNEKNESRNRNDKYYRGKMTYQSPNEICPFIGFQAVEATIARTTEITAREKDGFCMMWSLLFFELCLLFPTLRSNELIDEFMKHTSEMVSEKKQGLFFRNIIRGYTEILYDNINHVMRFTEPPTSIRELNDIIADLNVFPWTLETQQLTKSEEQILKKKQHDYNKRKNIITQQVEQLILYNSMQFKFDSGARGFYLLPLSPPNDSPEF